MKCPSGVDERFYAHIKQHSPKKKKNLLTKIKSLSYTTMFSSFIVVAASIFLGVSQMPSNSDISQSSPLDSIELTLKDIDTAISFLEDDSQREFDTL